VTKNQAEKIYTLFGWRILEEKFCYYYPNDAKIECTEDVEYDKMEELYKQACGKLEVESVACNYVGFPRDLPCGRLVMSKMTGDNPVKTKISLKI